jgi:hypothetical protein
MVGRELGAGLSHWLERVHPLLAVIVNHTGWVRTFRRSGRHQPEQVRASSNSKDDICPLGIIGFFLIPIFHTFPLVF